jgi:hypothetical protein
MYLRRTIVDLPSIPMQDRSIIYVQIKGVVYRRKGLRFYTQKFPELYCSVLSLYFSTFNWLEVSLPFRYSVGERLKCFLKQRLKYFGSLKPTS